MITRSTLKNLAGATAFARGEDYYTSGLVGDVRDTGDKISARVEGTEIYRVKLWNENDELEYDCTCPRAADGYFCKHCVAVGLAWLEERRNVGIGPANQKKERADPWQAIRDYLSLQKPEALIGLVLDAAERDDRIYQSLLLKAERLNAGGNLLPTFRKAIDKATRVCDFVDWREAGGFAGNLETIVESLEELLTPDSAALLAELAEYAIERVENAMQNIDDSDGEVGGIVDDLGDLHIQACELAESEPAALADRLFHLETTLPIGICSFNAEKYRHVLGPEGLRRYRELVEEEWRKIKPKQKEDRFDYHRFRITSLMESLARASGNMEELVAIKARDLSSAYQYLTIAEIWAKTGESDKALDWAERGLQAFPTNTDNRLRDFLVTAYLERQRNEEALQLTWIQFEERPALEHFQKLHSVAERLGVWPAQRERALVRVSDEIARSAAAAASWQSKPAVPDYSLRLKIALWENHLEEAWQATQAGKCDMNLLIQLAGKLEVPRADDALVLYKRVVPPIVEQTNNRAYAEAIELIRRMAGIMTAQKRSHELGDYLAELRLRYKPKRNFIKLLDDTAARMQKTQR
jgi:uncharacterized Zn finger protein